MRAPSERATTVRARMMPASVADDWKIIGRTKERKYWHYSESET